MDLKQHTLLVEDGNISIYSTQIKTRFLLFGVKHKEKVIYYRKNTPSLHGTKGWALNDIRGLLTYLGEGEVQSLLVDMWLTKMKKENDYG